MVWAVGLFRRKPKGSREGGRFMAKPAPDQVKDDSLTVKPNPAGSAPARSVRSLAAEAVDKVGRAVTAAEKAVEEAATPKERVKAERRLADAKSGLRRSQDAFHAKIKAAA